ncbi:MAG TPA: Rrf2 family transcriptional regulator [Candidatus Sumerlaeota bacterium]|nr:MAG: iron-responsive transcriptional regulator [candidate division BRC1 bacterium ADurb.BinA292]HOE94964.1 Rrf2 family transcriptional regulator [Candidatus Sumerlaeota bacterium]HOR29083.1 Rrf2 family transcriptional regulator [Candidatus Sumerlaeota bacterium]HPK01377.1 Rrf2 family transcriptional regulator [Candidatus Sumerlaeota bacterium]
MFSQTSEYAIRALSILARYPRDQFILVGTLAQSAELPHHYLSKILQNLVRMQILESRKGSKGGFRLARDPNEITLYEIVNAIENLGQTRRCLLGQADCSDERACPLHEFWVEQTASYLDTLQHTSLGDLVRFDGKLRSTARPKLTV